jgi:nucleotide-binding universal stress UspA family protein
MKTIRKIMVATDFSKDSQSALDEAVVLAEKLNAEVYLLHAVDKITDCVADYCLSEDQSEGAKSNALGNARRNMDREIGRFADRKGVSIKADLRYGRTYEEIVKAESEKNIDLLVIGPHARKTAWQRFTTHLSDKIERNPSVDTLVVHGAV